MSARERRMKGSGSVYYQGIMLLVLDCDEMYECAACRRSSLLGLNFGNDC